MKKAILFLFVAVILFSCSKEKEPSIVGSWKETSVYVETSSGVYQWEPATRWPLLVTFKREGEYTTQQETAIDRGKYLYYPNTRELKFTSAASSANTAKVVSFLDGKYMEIDYLNDGVLSMRQRFTRTE